MPRVNVIYHHFPHYRRPVMRALARSGRHEYSFWGDIADYQGIKAFRGDELVEIHPVTFAFDEQTSRVDIARYWPAVLDRSADALIVIGNANMPATWIMAVAGRLVGKKVLFWAHGWRRKERPLKARIRNFYYGLANRVMLYGHRAVELAEASGFPARKLSVIYNSLDWETSREIDLAMQSQDRGALRQELGIAANDRVLICSARLNESCRFDLLIEAARLLGSGDNRVRLVLIGDGPQRAQLEEQAAGAGVDATFTGAIYDENQIARHYHAADLTVSPGKVGLTAVHSMTYGVPVITHDNLDDQMPEFETIEPGATGAFFRQGDAADLAAVIAGWFAGHSDRSVVGDACRRVVAEKYNPGVQARLIDAAVDEVLG